MDEKELEEKIRDYGRTFARYEISFLNELRSEILGQHTEMFKWITASLLAINGGAIIAVFGAQGLSPLARVFSCIAFILGIFCALLIGIFLQKISTKLLEPIKNTTSYWIECEVDGVRDLDIEVNLGNELLASLKSSWMVPAWGWVSATFFTVGAMIVGCDILNLGGL